MNVANHDNLSSSPALAVSPSQYEAGSTFSSDTIPLVCAENVNSLQDNNQIIPTPLEETSDISGGVLETSSVFLQVEEAMDAIDGIPDALPGQCFVQANSGLPSGGLVCLPGMDSGAVDLQPAPTVSSQTVPLCPFGAMDLAGLLLGKGASASPLQEQLANQFSVSNTTDLKILDIRHECSNLNNSADSQVFQEIFSQKSQEYTEVDSNTKKFQNSFVEKFLQSSFCDKQPSCIKDNTILLNSNREGCNAVPQNVDKSEPSTSQNVRPEKSKTSYAKATAPPNTHQQIIGTAPDCGVMFDRIQGVNLDTYALAIQNTIGKGHISFIGRDPGNDNLILIFLKSSKWAQELVEKGIWIRGQWLLASFFQQPATKLIVSGVMPFIPDDLIIKALSPYGTSVYKFLRRVPAALRLHQLKGSYSYRREVYLVKSSKDIVIPPSLTISFLEINYSIDISSTGVKCFTCGSLYHTVTKCDKTVGESFAASNTLSAVLNQVPDKQSNKLPISQASETSDGLMAHSLQPLTEVSRVAIPNAQCKSFFSQCNLAALPPLRLLQQPNKKLPFSSVKKRETAPNSEVSAETTSPITENNIPDPKKVAIPSVSSLLIDQKKEDGHKHYYPGQQSKEIIASKLTKTQADPVISVSEALVSTQMFVSSAKKKPRTSLNHPYMDAVAGFSSSSWSLLDKPSLEKDVLESSSEMEDESIITPPTSYSIVHSDKIPLAKNAVSVSKDNKVSYEKVQLVEDSSIVNNSSDSSHDKQNNQACVVVANWLKKIKKLKTTARNNYTSSLIQEYPNLETMLTYVISVKELYPPSTAKGKKVRALLAELKTPLSASRSSRTTKRKQTSPSSFI